MFDKKNSETRSFLDDLRNFEKDVFFDLGHPLLNRIADCFIRAAGIGAVQALSKEAYFTVVEGDSLKTQKLRGFRGETNQKSVEALVMRTGKETLQWGMVAGAYSGLTYGLKEARGVHDWKNSALAGALTGSALAMTLENNSHENIVQCVITGAAISTAANLLAGGFSDADWASCVDDRRSTGCHCVFIGGNPVIWSAEKQDVVARSSTESEYRSLRNLTTDVVWLQAICAELGVPVKAPHKLWCDNSGAISLARNPLFHARTKHIELDVREKVADNTVDVGYVPTADQTADIFTKPLPEHRFQLLREKLKLKL